MNIFSLKYRILAVLGMLSAQCDFNPQEISQYVRRSLQEKKLLYYGMENLDFTFYDPVSNAQHIYCLFFEVPMHFFRFPNHIVYLISSTHFINHISIFWRQFPAFGS